MLPREPVKTRVVPSGGLTPNDLDDIWRLTTRYVEADRPYFERKLRELPEVALFRTVSGDLVGVSALEVYRVRYEGRTPSVIFTSSVVIDERYRRQNLVLRLGVRTYLREKLRRPWAPIFWFFDTFSYKSYVLLARNLAEFWPRREQPTPTGPASLMDFLSKQRYGADWIPAAGVVNRSGKKRLRPETAPIDEFLRQDPDIGFFDRANPGHREGDMLVCLCPLTLGNMASAITRGLRRRRQVRHRVQRMRHSAAMRRQSEAHLAIPE